MNIKEGVINKLIIVVVIFMIIGIVGYVILRASQEPEAIPVEGNVIEEVAIIDPVGSQKVTEDEVVGWKTYRDEEYGFEIKYPSEWNYKQKTLTGGGKSSQFSDEAGMYVLSINTPIREIGYEPSDTRITEDVIIPGTNKFFKKTVFSSSTNKNVIVLVNWNFENFVKSGEIVIRYEKENDPIIKTFNQILSSFKFID